MQPVDTIRSLVDVANGTPRISRMLAGWDRTVAVNAGATTVFIVVDSGRARVVSAAPRADVSFTLSPGTLEMLVAGRITPLVAKLKGQIRCSGSTGDVLRFASILTGCVHEGVGVTG